jgi:hypothetical protein
MATGFVQHRIVEYDALRRRLWIFGQRCHHGAMGSIVATAACCGLALERGNISTWAATAAAGGVLMAHDWSDRSIWFERGRGNQR